MPPKRNAVQGRIQAFQSALAEVDADAAQTAIRKALKDRHCLLVKQAAEVCEERLSFDLEADLLAAYRRFLKNPIKSDPHCMAKGAIVRALVALDCQNAEFFLAGLSYQQPEPVWGGTEDTAVDLRVSCAMGLVNTTYPRALVKLVTLLNDPYPRARMGAVRAISFTPPLAAEAVLRAKALAGDAEPDVTSDALGALLQVAPGESKVFVLRFLEACRDPVLRESIALTLGESKQDEALDILRTCWDNEPFKREQDNAFLLGAIFHRSEKAFAWLLDVVAEGDRGSARFVIEQLAIYGSNAKLRKGLAAAIAKRGREDLRALFNEIWR